MSCCNYAVVVTDIRPHTGSSRNRRNPRDADLMGIEIKTVGNKACRRTCIIQEVKLVRKALWIGWPYNQNMTGTIPDENHSAAGHSVCLVDVRTWFNY
eukprot:1048711-Amphidinium_carterae.1